MTFKSLSHIVLAGAVGLGVAGPMPAAAFAVSVDPLPTLTFPKNPDKPHSSRGCAKAASPCTATSGR